MRGSPILAHRALRCHVLGVGQVTGWSHENHGCADSLVFRTWLEAIPESEYAVLASARPTWVWQLQCRATWKQLCLLYNGDHPKVAAEFQWGHRESRGRPDTSGNPDFSAIT